MDIRLPDITGPIGMLKCLAALRELPTGDALFFTVRDSDVYRTLVKVFGRDAGCCTTIEKTAEGHHMIVRKREMRTTTEE